MNKLLEEIGIHLDVYALKNLGKEIYYEEDDSELAFDFPDMNSAQAIGVLNFMAREIATHTFSFHLIITLWGNEAESQKKIIMSLQKYAHNIRVDGGQTQEDPLGTCIDLSLSLEETRSIIEEVAKIHPQSGRIDFAFYATIPNK